jgi:hypothetical protein
MTLSDFIVSSEENASIYNYQINGIHVWPVIRYWLENKQINLKTNPEIAEVEKQKNRILGLFHSIYLLLRFFFKKNEIHIFQNSASRLMEYNGETIAPHIYPLVKKIAEKENVFIWENPTSRPISKIKSFPSFNKINFLSRIPRFLIKRKIIKLDEQKILSNHLSCLLSPVEVEQCIDHARILSLLSHIFRFYFKVAKPKAVMVSCYYSRNGMAFVAAAKCLNIPCIELQHGAQGPNHYAYKGFNSFSYFNFNTVPNVYWCWTQSEADYIQVWLGNAGVASNIGYPARLLSIDLSGFPFVGSEKIALYTVDLATDKNLVKQILTNNSEWFWLIRLHPSCRGQINEWTSYLKAFAGHVDIKWATFSPLTSVLSKAKFHVTHYSGTVIDARLCNVPSIVTNSRGLELNPVLVEEGWIKFHVNPNLNLLQADLPASEKTPSDDYFLLLSDTLKRSRKSL